MIFFSKRKKKNFNNFTFPFFVRNWLFLNFKTYVLTFFIFALFKIFCNFSYQNMKSNDKPQASRQNKFNNKRQYCFTENCDSGNNKRKIYAYSSTIRLLIWFDLLLNCLIFKKLPQIVRLGKTHSVTVVPSCCISCWKK